MASALRARKDARVLERFRLRACAGRPAHRAVVNRAALRPGPSGFDPWRKQKGTADIALRRDDFFSMVIPPGRSVGGAPF